MTSIAWPTIGCGNLNYQKDFVAAAMFNEVLKFSVANPSTSLRDVRIVIHAGDQPTIDVITQYLQSVLSEAAAAQTTRRTAVKTTASEYNEDVKLEPGKYFM
jgi:hypothetical protein